MHHITIAMCYPVLQQLAMNLLSLLFTAMYLKCYIDQFETKNIIRHAVLSCIIVDLGGKTFRTIYSLGMLLGTTGAPNSDLYVNKRVVNNTIFYV